MSIELNDFDFKLIQEFVREKYGINLEEKRALIEARLAFDISKRGYSSFSTYIAHVMAHPDGDECQHMINRLSTNYSYFFRESHYIKHFTKHVLPEFNALGRKHIKIWSAACSGGQEAYSLAMVLRFAIDFAGIPISYSIVGTDINTNVLEIAKRGVYGIDEINAIPKCYRQFTRKVDSDHFTLTDNIKEMVTWECQNLLEKNEDSAQYDIVFCRNALIYFKSHTRKKLVRTLFNSVQTGGYLYTGATESIDLERKYFKYVAPSIYKKDVFKS